MVLHVSVFLSLDSQWEHRRFWTKC